jgi:hypothetical protein
VARWRDPRPHLLVDMESDRSFLNLLGAGRVADVR